MVVSGCASPPDKAPAPSGPSEPPRSSPETAPQLEREPVMRSIRSTVPDTPCPLEFSGSCYPVWFGTNRKPIDPNELGKGFSGEFDDGVRYGKRVVFIPHTHRPGELGSPLWRRLLSGVDDRLTLGPGTHFTEEVFAREIRAFLAGLHSNDQNILVYIHGFNTSFDEAVKRAAQLGHDLKVPGITALYSWPSRASLSSYLADVGSIEASEEHIAQFLVQMAGMAGQGKVHIIAHSMGNRGLLRAMHRATTQAALRSGVKFGQIFLAAPDVDATLFRQLAGVYPQISERTTLYVADQDKALAAMEWLSRGARAGSAPPLVLMPGIDTIRVRGAGLFRLGHSYVAEEVAVLKDIRALLHWREPPEKRAARNRWPIPDDSPLGRGAWVIGE
jgi:esterase/lipase superfamily enzyme